MKSKSAPVTEDVLKQLLSKLSDIEARLQVIEVYADTKLSDKYSNDYCHADFIKTSYPTYQSVVYCECDKCSTARKSKDFK